jgi:hypothetical protein
MQSPTFAWRLSRRALPLAAIATLAIAPSGHAQFGRSGGMGGSQEPMVRFGIGGGVTVPVSDAKDAFENGVNGTGFVLIRLVGGLPALRFAFSYDRFNLKSQGLSGTNVSPTDAGTSQVLGGTAGIKLHLIPGPIRPFVMAGLGAFDVRNAVNATSGAQQSSSNINFGVDGGGGIEIKLGRLSAFAEGRIQNVFQRTNGTNVFISKSSIQSVPVTFGLLF